jgi:hypothetical protein
MNVEINFLGVALAAVSSMLIGYFWYAPKGFGNTWTRLAKIDPKKFNTSVAMSSAVVSSLVMAYGLAYATFVSHAFFMHSFLTDALLTALFVTVAFQAIRMFQRAQFNQDSHTETAIHIGNEVVIVMVMALIIGLNGA